MDQPTDTSGRPRGGASGDTGLRPFLWRVLIVAGVGALTFLAWRAADALLLVFAGVLLAILLLRLTGIVRQWTGLGHGWGLGVVLAMIVLLAVGGGWLMGTTMAGQFGQLGSRLNEAVDALPDDVRTALSENAASAPWTSYLQSAAGHLVGFLSYLVIALFVGIYTAASPAVYRRGLELLVPRSGQARTREVLDASGDALWKWLQGQLLSMAVVGVLTTAGLMMLGVPAALALGIVAMVLEFIPLIGPFLAAAPAVLIAFAQSPTLAIWTALLYLAIQQVEGNVIMPIAQKRVVHLPPVITIAAITAGGLLFGILGMFLATPLAVLMLVLVNLLYVEDRLGRKRRFPE
ncbi:AI-2E family transporter [Azospirillum halopraeferens]|uniref:AI-2E family transporter n=1 Tax=Azospirillum halopraeferens TaxID=34010 RepID=UPI000411032B|nr:AI-2E family transporter [Azospirillum halopraeferens]